MRLPSLKIRHLDARFPVIQAGMGVRVGNADLAAATINLGGYGTIASVGLATPSLKKDFISETNRLLAEEIKKAKSLCDNKKPLGVNIMVALSNYRELIEQSIKSEVDYIISGAGIPLYLPEYVGDKNIALIPVLSNPRAVAILLKAWGKKYNRQPDAIIIEGPNCGGHLGFTEEMLKNPETCSLDILLKETQKVLNKFKLDIPIIAAGDISCREDIEQAINAGFDGVQIGTRFMATEEAGIDIKSKEVLVNATSDDVVVIKSPVGLPVRVLKTPLVDRIMHGQREQFACPFRCLRTCKPAEAPFCIAEALLATMRGDVEDGLYMVGNNIDAIDKIISLKEFFEDLED